MKRLTERDEFGNADIIGVDSDDLQMNLDFNGLNRVTDALNRLADYEDTGFLPKDMLSYISTSKEFHEKMTITVNMTHEEYEDFKRFQEEKGQSIKYEELERNYRQLCQSLLTGLNFEPVYSEDAPSKMLRAQKIEITNAKALEDGIIMADKWLFGVPLSLV